MAMRVWSGLGPVFAYEWLTASQRGVWQGYALRSLLGLLLLLGLSGGWLGNENGKDELSVQQMATIGQISHEPDRARAGRSPSGASASQAPYSAAPAGPWHDLAKQADWLLFWIVAWAWWRGLPVGHAENVQRRLGQIDDRSLAGRAVGSVESFAETR